MNMRWLLVILTSLSGSMILHAADSWPAFRGHGDAIATGEYPTTWTAEKGIGWKINLPGYGQSAPIVWNGNIYLTAVEGEQREKGYILALDAKTGKEKWRHTFEPDQKAKWSFTISRAAPTPCADANGIYCFFEGGNLIALTHDGRVRWQRSLVQEYGKFQGGHGVGSSPAQTADTLFLLIDDRGPSYLVAIDKETGKTKWKTDREPRGGWSSPVIAKQDGTTEIIASSAGTIISYAADTGTELWKLDNIVGNTIPSASVIGEYVLFGGGTSRAKMDVPANARSNGCLKLTRKDGQPHFDNIWNAKAGISNYATPLGHKGIAYFVNQVGVVYAHDLTSGKEIFVERIAGPCWASPVGAGEYVYFFGKDGTTTVLKAGSAFEIVSTNKLWDAKPMAAAPPSGANDRATGEYGDPIVYGIAAADGAFFIRTGSELYRVQK